MHTVGDDGEFTAVFTSLANEMAIKRAIIKLVCLSIVGFAYDELRL